MPLKKPLQTIKKKLGLEKTFKQKREALGVRRVSAEGNRISPNLITNSKIKQVIGDAELKRRKIITEITKLQSIKPKNELEARKKKEAILKLKEDLDVIKSSKTLSLHQIKEGRDIARAQRQEKIIFKKLLSVISSDPAIKINRNKLLSSSYNLKLLRRNYQYFLKTRNKTFVDITPKEAVDILERSVTKKLGL